MSVAFTGILRNKYMNMQICVHVCSDKHVKLRIDSVNASTWSMRQQPTKEQKNR